MRDSVIEGVHCDDSNSGEQDQRERRDPNHRHSAQPAVHLIRVWLARSSSRVEPPWVLFGWARYASDRQIPADALTSIGINNHRLYRPAADAFVRMVADAADAGVTIGITDSYRSYDQQVRLAEEKGLYRNGGLAATPGTSNHGWGLAVDFDLDDAAQR